MNSIMTEAPGASSDTIVEKFLTVEGCRVRYLTGGSGPPLLLIHGLLGYSFSWRFNLPELARIATVYALDLPGTGFSERIGPEEASQRALTRKVMAFMKEVEITSTDLLGSSHGGAIAMQVAAAAPQHGIHVRKLILVSPVNPWSRFGRLRIAALGSWLGAKIFRPLSPLLLPLHGYFLRRMYADPKRIAPGTVEGYSRAILVPGTMDALLARVRHWKRDLADLERSLPAIARLPMLIIWGGADRAVDPASAQPLMKHLPLSRLQILPNAGHLPYEEQPAEFNFIVLQFLQETG
jgi:pimeloyl-ACP methyl ester carboxylesterase